MSYVFVGVDTAAAVVVVGLTAAVVVGLGAVELVAEQSLYSCRLALSGQLSGSSVHGTPFQIALT
jgi:cyanophycinase-like exopeptidase